MMNQLLLFFSTYLIEVMGGILVVALAFRWFAYFSSRFDQAYFSTFTRQVELNIEKDKDKGLEIHNVDDYLSDLLNRVGQNLPNRSLRGSKSHHHDKVIRSKNSAEASGKRVLSLRDYVSGKQSLIMNIQSEGNVFKNPHPPKFQALTSRIMQQDKNWMKLFGVIPIDSIIRLIDILPGIFIVFGVFGTFIGISMALPEIARIDFNNLEASGEVLTRFVLNVTFAMKTSIAGIFFSLILTFLNTFFPIKEVRIQIFKKMETCFQYIWYTIHGDVDNQESLIEVLRDLKEAIVELKEAQKDSPPPIRKSV